MTNVGSAGSVLRVRSRVLTIIKFRCTVPDWMEVVSAEGLRGILVRFRDGGLSMSRENLKTTKQFGMCKYNQSVGDGKAKTNAGEGDKDAS
jgi:hypothetical protein